jgi:hypothetical protein
MAQIAAITASDSLVCSVHNAITMSPVARRRRFSAPSAWHVFLVRYHRCRSIGVSALCSRAPTLSVPPPRPFCPV